MRNSSRVLNALCLDHEVANRQRRVTSDHVVGSGNNVGIDNLSINGTVEILPIVPEPSAFAVTALALLPMGMIGWRRRRGSGVTTQIFRLWAAQSLLGSNGVATVDRCCSC